MAYLAIEAGETRGRFPLTDELFRIGRSRYCTAVLEHPQVSREHAVVTLRDGDYYIEDLRSRHGTFINGRRVEGAVRLEDQDVIQVVTYSLRFARGESLASPDPLQTVAATPEDVGLPPPVIVSTLNLGEGQHAQPAPSRPETVLQALLEIGRSLQSALVLDQLLPEVLQAVLLIFTQAEYAFVLLLDGEELTSKASKSRDGNPAPAVRISRTVVRQALEKKQAILSGETSTDGEVDVSQSISSFGIRSIVCAPLINRQGEAIGVLHVHSEQSGHVFTHEDLEVLVGVTGTLSMAVENARLHEEEIKSDRMLREAELAWDVQRRFLPASRPAIVGYEFFDYYDAASSVGGDYYGFTNLPDGRLGVAIGDVSGKGIPAAMLMARLSSDVRYSLLMTADPARALEALNKTLSEAEIEGKFVTLALLVLDPKEHVLTVANAGHGYPLLVHSGGKIEEIGAGSAGLPLNVSMDPEYVYKSVTVRLEPGSCVVVYTDGVSEARNEAREMFGMERLCAPLRDGTKTPAEAGAAVMDDVTKFVGQAPQHDDATLVCFGRV